MGSERGSRRKLAVGQLLQTSLRIWRRCSPSLQPRLMTLGVALMTMPQVLNILCDGRGFVYIHPGYPYAVHKGHWNLPHGKIVGLIQRKEGYFYFNCICKIRNLTFIIYLILV